MDPLSQGALGAVAAQSAAPRRALAAATVCGALAGMAPDLDTFIRSADDPLLYLEYHRQFSHALIFIPLGSWLCAVVLFLPLRRALTGRGRRGFPRRCRRTSIARGDRRRLRFADSTSRENCLAL